MGSTALNPPLPKSVKVDTILQVQFIVYKDPGPVDQISHRSWSFFPASDLQLNYFHYSTYMNLTQWDRVGIFQTPPNAHEKFKFLRYHSFFMQNFPFNSCEFHFSPNRTINSLLN